MSEQLGIINIYYSLGLISLCTLISLLLGLSLEKKILMATFRACLQLSLLGYVLKWLFEQEKPWVFVLVFFFMAFIASHTA
ncbi:MAG: ABC transporter permease, partial [Bdellovibrionota bacterium]|nr:ABC transporter permease [Bdellovibrionota bacterium]